MERIAREQSSQPNWKTLARQRRWKVTELQVAGRLHDCTHKPLSMAQGKAFKAV